MFVGVATAQQERTYLADFMAKAEISASKDLSMFKFDIGQRYDGIGTVKMNDLYAQFDSKWSNVIMALTMAKASGKSMAYVLSKYNRSKPTDWQHIASELEIIDGAASKHKIHELIASQVKAWKLEDKN